MTSEILDTRCPCVAEKDWMCSLQCKHILQHCHHKEKIVSEDECKDIGSAGDDWEWELVSHLSAKSLEYTQEVVKFLEEAEFNSYYLLPLKILQHCHHKEKILNEDECKDIGSAGRDWEWKLVSHLSAKSLGYTQEVVKFLEEAEFDSYYLQPLKILQHFHRKEKILSEDECKDIGSAGDDWEWKLVSHLSAKSLGYTQEVVKFLEEANFESYYLEPLKILHHFRHKDKVLSEEECKDIALARGDWKRKIASYLSLKAIENIQETVQFLEKERFGSDYLQCLKILHHFRHEDKVLSEEECKDIALARGDWKRKLVSHLSLKPIENTQEIVQFLEKERFGSDYLQCLKTFKSLYEEKLLTEDEIRKHGDDGFINTSNKSVSDMERIEESLRRHEKNSTEVEKLKVLLYCQHKAKVLDEDECKYVVSDRVEWEWKQRLVSCLWVKPFEDIKKVIQYLEKEHFDRDALQALQVLSKVLLQSKDLQLPVALVDLTSKGYLNRLQILQKLPSHLCFSLVVAEIVYFNKFEFIQYHVIHEEGVLLQKLKVVLGEVEKYTENTTARGHFTDRLRDDFSRYFYRSISNSVARAYQDIFGGSYELGERLGEIIKMFWKDQLKEEEFKRILKEKDFSGLQHAKQAALSRIYQPRPAISRIYQPATATFEPHGYSQTSLLTSHFKTKSESILSREEYEDTIFGTKQLKSPKSIESMKSKFMDSVATFSEKKKILQKSSLVSGSESLDPKEPGDPSPHELEHEEQLDQLCWIPFGIQSLQVDQTGGRFSLEPDEDRPVESDVTHLEVPEGAVPEKRKVQIRYGIIMDGPLVAPDGYKLASPVVYIHYNSKDIKSPITLHLPHWSADTDRVKMMMAPHSPVNNKFTFEDYEGAGNGRDFLITGHCTLYTEASKLEDPSVYLASAWESNDGSMTPRITATYNHYVWIKILEKHWETFYTVEQPYNFKFLEGEDTLKCKLEPGCHGKISGRPQIKKEDIVYETGNKKLKKYVETKMYPSYLTLRLVQNRGSTSEDPPYENVSLQGIDHSISYYIELSSVQKVYVGSSIKDGSAAKLAPVAKKQKVIEKSPQEIINFLDQHNEGYIQFCNAKAVCTDLEREHVISAGQRQQLESSQSVAESNCLFYQFLRNDPAPETLKRAAKVLKNASETTNTNKTFATLIDTLLQSC